MQRESLKLILIITASMLFIAGFVLNITSDESLYNQDLLLVPTWQATSALGSSSFMGFMNVISILFDPPVCAGYLALFWLLSSRRLQLMVFLVWFILLSWVLSILKSAIHQARPFWVGAGIEMKSWTCYTEYGCPSGHAWLALVVLEFFVRFYARGYPVIRRHIGWFYLIVAILEALVMFSRVILGMHSFNQVLMGAMLGMFSLCIYYAYVERMLVSAMKTILNTDGALQSFKNRTAAQRKGALAGIVGGCMAVMVGVDLAVFYGIDYQNQTYWATIQNIEGCGGVKLYKSFQYRCLQDSAIGMAAMGILFSLIFAPDPSIFVRPLSFSLCSWMFLVRFILLIVVAAIPLAAFLNPGWAMIDVDVSSLAIILWVCQMLGFFLGLVMLVLVGPVACRWAGVEGYRNNQYGEVRKEGTPLVQIEQSHSSQRQSQR